MAFKDESKDSEATNKHHFLSLKSLRRDSNSPTKNVAKIPQKELTSTKSRDYILAPYSWKFKMNKRDYAI